MDAPYSPCGWKPEWPLGDCWCGAAHCPVWMGWSRYCLVFLLLDWLAASGFRWRPILPSLPLFPDGWFWCGTLAKELPLLASFCLPLFGVLTKVMPALFWGSNTMCAMETQGSHRRKQGTFMPAEPPRKRTAKYCNTQRTQHPRVFMREGDSWHVL